MKHRNPLPDGAKNSGRRPTMPNTLLLHVFVMFSQQTRGRRRVRLIQFRPLDSVTNNCAPRSAKLIGQYVRSIFVHFHTNKSRWRALLTKLWPLYPVKYDCAPRPAILIKQYARPITIHFQTNKGRRRVLLTKLWPLASMKTILRSFCRDHQAITWTHYCLSSNKQGKRACPLH